jgi:hypothetical protein
MGRWLLLSSLLFINACGGAEVVVQEPPRLEIRCPDPAARFMLREGYTYRDLARSRAEALAGWRSCYDGLEVAEGRAGAPQ